MILCIQEKDKYEAERELVKTEYEGEISELQTNLKRLQEARLHPGL